MRLHCRRGPTKSRRFRQAVVDWDDFREVERCLRIAFYCVLHQQVMEKEGVGLFRLDELDGGLL